MEYLITKRQFNLVNEQWWNDPKHPEWKKFAPTDYEKREGKKAETVLNNLDPHTIATIFSIGTAFIPVIGPFGRRCLLMDGLFLAVNTKTTNKLNWDENVKFHHYDLIFCLEAHKQKLKMGTAAIYVTHESPGLQSFSEEFKKSDNYFKEYYKNY